MADMLRPDGKPFVVDYSPRIPAYVVEVDSRGRTVLMNQFTGMVETVSETDVYEDNDVYVAFKRLKKAEFEAFDAELIAKLRGAADA